MRRGEKKLKWGGGGVHPFPNLPRTFGLRLSRKPNVREEESFHLTAGCLQTEGGVAYRGLIALSDIRNFYRWGLFVQSRHSLRH